MCDVSNSDASTPASGARRVVTPLEAAAEAAGEEDAATPPPKGEGDVCVVEGAGAALADDDEERPVMSAFLASANSSVERTPAMCIWCKRPISSAIEADMIFFFF